MALSDDIIRMKQNMSDDDIIKSLAEKGYTPVEIVDAFSQAKLKQSMPAGPSGLMPSIMQQQETPVPSPIQAQPQAAPEASAYYPYVYPTAEQPQMVQPKIDTENIEEITEEIINEKWSEFKTKIGDIAEWKLYMEGRSKGMDDRLKRIELSLDKLQAALLGKVQEYGQSVRDLGAEIDSLEMAFSKVLDPLMTNIKELGKITDSLKKEPVKKEKARK
jgi:hypothetical protein